MYNYLGEVQQTVSNDQHVSNHIFYHTDVVLIQIFEWMPETFNDNLIILMEECFGTWFYLF